MGRSRTVGPVIEALGHGGVVRTCRVMTEIAISTVELPEGHFASIVLSLPNNRFASLAILDRDDVEATIELLRNAMDDADRGDRGEPMVTVAQLKETH